MGENLKTILLSILLVLDSCWKIHAECVLFEENGENKLECNKNSSITEANNHPYKVNLMFSYFIQ